MPKKPANTTRDEPASGPRWTCLDNHAHVLAVLHSDPKLVLRQVAARVGVTERAAQRIIQDLRTGGFIERERVGRQNRYKVIANESLRHPIESHRTIGDLLRLMNRSRYVRNSPLDIRQKHSPSMRMGERCRRRVPGSF